MKTRAPAWTYLPEYRQEKREILKLVAKVLSSGQLILGPEVAAFEKSFTQFCQRRFGIGVGSGTDALFLSLKALNIGLGDEVVTVPNTAIPTVSAIVATGARPVFVDVCEDTLLMDTTKLEATVTARTRCIIPVHLYGQCCDMEAINKIVSKLNRARRGAAAAASAATKRAFLENSRARGGVPLRASSRPWLTYNDGRKGDLNLDDAKTTARRRQRLSKTRQIFVLEDCAQATGARWHGKLAGTMSDIAAFSFYPTKIVGAYGDAGAVVTNSRRLAEKVKMLRFYGTRGDYFARFEGYNSRLDELQAALLSFKLKRINSYIAERRTIARTYLRELTGTPLKLIRVHPKADHVWHLFVVRHRQRAEIITYLKRVGIGVGIHYPHPIHLMPAYRFLGYQKGDFPVAERAASEVFSLPIYPFLPANHQERVIAGLRGWFKKKSS